MTLDMDAKTDSKKILILQSHVLQILNELKGFGERLLNLEKKVVTGNGNDEIPLIEQVRDNTQFIDAMKKVIWIVGGAILLQTVSFGYAVAVAYFRFLPVLEKLANKP